MFVDAPERHPDFLKDRPLKNILGDDTPPPRKTDRLFRATSESQTNACVSAFSSGSEHRDGYRTAARSLASQACEVSGLLDICVHPIAYLYRHHAELVLKKLILIASDLADCALTSQQLKTLDKDHGVSSLWKILRPLLNQVCQKAGNPPFPAEDLEGIDSYIQQIHQYDPDGQRWRYPTTSKKGPSLPVGLHNINIRVLSTGMEILADYLDSVESWFEHLFQSRGPRN